MFHSLHIAYITVCLKLFIVYRCTLLQWNVLHPVLDHGCKLKSAAAASCSWSAASVQRLAGACMKFISSSVV